MSLASSMADFIPSDRLLQKDRKAVSWESPEAVRGSGLRTTAIANYLLKAAL